jgi:hypothetical protein
MGTGKCTTGKWESREALGGHQHINPGSDARGRDVDEGILQRRRACGRGVTGSQCDGHELGQDTFWPFHTLG